jgi:small subunit ribosomal protein S4
LTTKRYKQAERDVRNLTIKVIKMAGKRLSAKYKISRTLGVNLWGRGKDSFNVRNYAPGQHGPAGKKAIVSDYGKQLKAKQQLKKYYGNITEKQFRRIYTEAARRKGDTGEQLIALLESRLDAIVYRANFATTVFAARQLVSHKHILVNGKKVNIASYQVKVGDVISVKEKSRQMTVILEALQLMEREVPSYFEFDAKAMTIKFIRLPKLDDVPYPVVMEPNLVVEFYSR